MHQVDIEIFRTAQTRINPGAMRRWLDRCGAEETDVPYVERGDLCETCRGSGFDVDYSSDCPACEGQGNQPPETSDAGAICGMNAKRCYLSFEPGLNPNVTRVRKDWHEYLTNVVASGHGSVIEHASYTYAIEGVTRVCEVELVRHRVGTAYSIQSGRYVRYDDVPFWMPKSLASGDLSLMGYRKCKECEGADCIKCYGAGKIQRLPTSVFEKKKDITRKILEDAFSEDERAYKELCDLWGIADMKSFATKKKLTSLFRRVIGQGVSTGITMTANMRAIRHMIAMRTHESAEEEIAYLFSMIAKDVITSEPSIMADFTRDEKTGAWVPGHWKV